LPVAEARPIANRPQVANPPHKKIVAGCKQIKTYNFRGARAKNGSQYKK